MNNLELELWPKMNELSVSNSGIIEEVEGNSENETEFKSQPNSGSTLHAALSNSSFVTEMAMTGSMAGAKNLLDEVKDPLGINDSLYQY